MAKTIWKIVLWANWLIILFFWWKGSGEIIGEGTALTVIAFARLAGLGATYMILQQFFFMGRTPWLERVFGLDKLSRLHARNGKWGIALLAVHPILIYWGYSTLSGISLLALTRRFLFEYEHVYLALIAFFIFLLIIATSIVIVRRKLRYESWYAIHLFAYLAIFFALFHQIEIGTTLTHSTLFYGYWILLYTIVFTNHAIFRIIRPVYNYFRFRFQVEKIVRENYNT